MNDAELLREAQRCVSDALKSGGGWFGLEMFNTDVRYLGANRWIIGGGGDNYVEVEGERTAVITLHRRWQYEQVQP